MPINRERLDDTQSSNPDRSSGRQDASRSNAARFDVRSGNARGGMGFNKGQTTTGGFNEVRTDRHLPNESDRQHSSDQGVSAGLLQIPSESSGFGRTSLTATWDWDAEIDSAGQADSYYYEPQGELLQAPQAQQKGQGNPLTDEFSIPYAVPGSGVQWHLGQPSTDDEGFAVPERPSSIPQKRKAASEASGSGKPSEPKRLSRASTMGDEESPAVEPMAPGRSRSQTDTAESRPRHQAGETHPRRTLTDPAIPMVLPARKVFPIQIGDKLFQLSGASISSDAPSYFSQFFEEQLRQNEGADSVRTLYIDRDPATFEDISLHLQGYHVEPRDGPHFVKLFADAQFFSLPRLTAQLFASTIYIRIGDEEFQIPRDLFSSPGDSPNFFSLGFSVFFTSPTDVFPGLSQRTLLRPPSILPPSVPNRSSKTFADLLHVLKGYPLVIRNEEHRAELLRDARYFHLKGLEQKLVPHQISYNLARKRSEIVIRLEDIRQSGISFVADGQPPSQTQSQGQSPASPASSTTASSTPNGPGWVYYQRPYADAAAYSLILEIGGEESTFLSIAPASAASPARVGRAAFHRQTLARITSLFSVIANKMNLPITQPLGLMMMERGAGVAGLPVSPGNTPISEDKVKVRIGLDADVTLDGEPWAIHEPAEDDKDDHDDDEESGMDVDEGRNARAKQRRRKAEDEDEGEDWVVRKAQWRLRVQPLGGGSAGSAGGKGGMEVILGAVKMEAFSSERGRNAARGFLV